MLKLWLIRLSLALWFIPIPGRRRSPPGSGPHCLAGKGSGQGDQAGGDYHEGAPLAADTANGWTARPRSAFAGRSTIVGSRETSKQPVLAHAETPMSESQTNVTPGRRRSPRQGALNVSETQDTHGRGAHEAESNRIRAIEEAIGSQSLGTPIDFESARKRELECIVVAEPSALFLERERRRDCRALA